MTDQTRWGIPEVQSRNKDRLYLATNLEVKTNKLNKLKEIYTSTNQLESGLQSGVQHLYQIVN